MKDSPRLRSGQAVLHGATSTEVTRMHQNGTPFRKYAVKNLRCPELANIFCGTPDRYAIGDENSGLIATKTGLLETKIW